MADIGYITLFLALVASVYSVVAYIFGTKGNHSNLINSARNGLLAVCGLVSLSVLILLYALLTHNFQIEYVASYTNRDLPTAYLISALWAGNSGSLLFWGWLLSIFASIMVLQKRTVAKELVPYASSVIMFAQAFFLVLIITVSNPFQKLPFAPPDGMGLNPLLENPGMIIHPPTLLAGYVSLTIPFAFAIAALLSRRLGDEWIIAMRRWTIMAWLALGVGNLIGAWWAYVELGWGGYWAWDPIESAGLMPWLVATAFLHSIMMQRRRGILKIWNMLLIIMTFNLAIFGTFLTRSGILSSVHTFNDTTLGPFFLMFLGVTLLGSLSLLYLRSADLKSEAEMESLISRESTFLLNNLLLIGATFAIFLGTVFPLLSEAVRGVKITVGPSFFNQVNGPIFLTIILLTGECTLIGWRRASIQNLIHNFLWPLVGAVILGTILLILDKTELYALIGYPVCSFVLFAILYQWFRGTKTRHNTRNENYFKAFFRLIGTNRPRYGGSIVHIAVILIAAGVIGSSLYDVEQEITINPGESIVIKEYTLNFENIDFYETQSKLVVAPTLSVYNRGEFIGKMSPEKYFHGNYQPVSEAAIRSTFTEDLYVILIDANENGTTSFKVLINPLVAWIWIGSLVFLIGGLIVFWPDRHDSLKTKPTRLAGREK